MRVFLIPSYYPDVNQPENAVFVKEQARALAQAGLEIVVLSIQIEYLTGSRKHKTDYETHDNEHVLYHYMRALAPMKCRSIIIKQYERRLETLILKAIHAYGRPDLLYAHFSFPAGAAAVSVSRKFNIPLVTQEHYSGIMKASIDRNLRNAIKKAVSGSKYFICVSEGLKQSIERHIGKSDNMMVISNMIDPSFSFAERTEKDIFVFLSIGNLIRRKGMDILIKAFVEEFQLSDKFQLIIAGDGMEKDRLQGLIKAYGADRCVTLFGHADRSQTLDLYKNCDCFVLASRAETFGIVYREAMAIGRPIISTRHGGFAENEWSDRFGEIVDIDDVEQLKQAMRKVFLNYDRYDLMGLSKECLCRCSEKSVVEQIINTFHSALKA